METSIQQILREHKVKGVFHTHVSMGAITGKYQINRQDLEEFWKVYNASINTDISIGIAEKPQHYLPVLGDIDIKIKETDDFIVEGNILHTDKHVKDIIEVYQSVLRKIVDECNDDHLTCVLLEKPLYRVNKNGNSYAKHGFHIHFPYCFLNKVDQEIHLIPRVQELVKEMNIFEDLGIEDSSQMIDKSCCTVPWLLYGSRKEAGMDPYLISKIFNSNGEEIQLENAFKNYQLFDEKEKLIKLKGKVKEYLPRILSIVPFNRSTCEVRHGLISPLKEKNNERKTTGGREFQSKSVTENLAIAKLLLPMLSDFRTEDRNEWMTIGWILYNIGNASDEGLELWCNFSSRCEDQYNEAVCIHHWERMTQKDLTLGTLRYYASIDSPEKYREFKTEQSTKFINESINGSHNDIAKTLYSEYGNEFVCASITSKTWYQFNNNKWESIDDGIFLREKISGDIVDRFSSLGTEALNKVFAATDKGEIAMHNARVNQIRKMVTNLKSAPFKSNVMKECCEVFYDKRFVAKLDTNPALFPFKNGVYDLNLNLFRPGRPEDFISKSSPIDYIEFSEDDEKVYNVYDFLEKVFPDKSIRDYFMDIASDIFMGGNHQKQVYFWTGEGDNGKSITQNLFDKMLGPLAIKFNTTVITGKKVQSGSANPELARAGGGVRLATLEEPNSDEVINIGILKNLSGNDTFYARDLFEKGKEGREITPLFKLFFICVCEGTSVSLNSGISASIEKLIYNHRLLSWDEKTNGLFPTNQQKLIYNGEQECIRLTLLDGRQITCTPNHKFLNVNNEWIEAKDIKLYDTQLKMGIDNPKCDDQFDNYEYIFKVGDMNFNLNDYSDRLKAAALCRIIGYVITDGSANKTLHLGHKIDVLNVQEDINLLTNKTPAIVKYDRTFGINLPSNLVKNITSIMPLEKGRKVYQQMKLPDFIFDDNCPIFLVREVLAGMFGGDGILPSMVKKSCTTMQLVASKEKKHLNSLVEMFKKLSLLLLNRFEINSIISEPKYYENYKTDLSGVDKYNVFLRISKNENLLKFIEKIGVRYCCHKSYRLTAIGSLLRYKKTVINQNQAIINRTRELLDKYKRQNVQPDIIQLNKDTNEIINSYKSTQEAQHATGLYHSGILCSIKRNGYCGGYKWIKQNKESEILDEPGCKKIEDAYKQALKEINENLGISDKENLITLSKIRSYYLTYKNDYKLYSFNIEKYLKDTCLFEFCNQQDKNKVEKHHYSVNKDMDTLPCYQMNVIHIENVGKKQVYDLNVEEPYSNFIAEGIITHNCNKLPKLKYSDKAVWNRIRVIPFESTFCRPDNPAPESYEEQLREKRFPMDKEFSNKIPGMVQAFAWILLKHRLTVKDRIEPEKVRAATAIYRKENDIYRQFVDECITIDKNSSLSLVELYSQFKDWFKDSLPNQTLPIKNEVEEYFSKLWDEPKNKKWKGYRIRTLQDDINDGDVIILEEDDLVDYESDAGSSSKPKHKLNM